MEKSDIEKGLVDLGKLANQEGITLDIAVYGGSAIALKWEFRRATRDVDIIINGDAEFLRKATKIIAGENDWPKDWMNDAVKGFSSPKGDHELYREYMHEQGGIRVFIPSARYLLAMKCMAMRIDEPGGSSDIGDIKELVGIVGVRNKSELCDLVESYYPKNQIQPKVYFGIEQIMQEVSRERREHNTPENSPGLSL